MHGTITELNPKEGCGVIHCDGLKIDVSLCMSRVKGDKQLTVGDVVSFLGFVGPKGPEAKEIILLWREVKTSTTANANSRNTVTTIQQVAKEIAVKLPNDRDQCASCGKLMIPSLVLSNGAPERSFCPFCGVVHKDFTKPSSPSIKHRAAEAAVGGVISVIVTGLLGL